MTLHAFNILPKVRLIEELTECCGSSAWVRRMLPFIPADDMVELMEDAGEQWYKCSEEDWKEAFSHHPAIGDIGSLSEGLSKGVFTDLSEKKKFAVTAQWALAEQGSVNTASQQTIEALAEANKLYKEKFGYIFIVCATGKSAEEMLDILQIRLKNTTDEEIRLAADEQNKITLLRLEKLLS